MPKYDDVTITINLRGADGNAHSIAQKVEEALRRMVCPAAAAKFRAEFLELIRDGSTDYDRVRSFCGEWVNVHYT